MFFPLISFFPFFVGFSLYMGGGWVGGIILCVTLSAAMAVIDHNREKKIDNLDHIFYKTIEKQKTRDASPLLLAFIVLAQIACGSEMQLDPNEAEADAGAVEDQRTDRYKLSIGDQQPAFITECIDDDMWLYCWVLIEFEDKRIEHYQYWFVDDKLEAIVEKYKEEDHEQNIEVLKKKYGQPLRGPNKEIFWRTDTFTCEIRILEAHIGKEAVSRIVTISDKMVALLGATGNTQGL